MKEKPIGIIGAGGWGTAISVILSDAGYNVLLWAYEKFVADEINNSMTNSLFLPGVTLPDSIEATSDLQRINETADTLFFAVPTQYIRNLLNQRIIDLSGKTIVNTAKGIEKGTLKRISEIFADAACVEETNYITLTGPSHAEEVARRAPTTVVAASLEHSNEKLLQKLLSTDSFRVYSSDDVIGCELGGALKNIIAIAAGIIDGLGLGDNAKAALMTRGLAEISRLGVALGANAMTFSGLSGLGDLIVTCSSKHSRNRYTGEQLALGRTIDDITSSMKMVAEGVSTTESAYFLGKKHNVEMPITEQIYKIIFQQQPPLKALTELMSRSSKREWWW
jgi:glycerol-3-phosphate dehydrogenase (NAD(P)+)